MALREYDFDKEPVVSIVKKILTDAVKMKASDIHFDPLSKELSIKFRINGSLQEYTIAPEAVKSNLTTRMKILSGMNITDSLRPQVGSINFESEGKSSNMQVSSLPVCNGEKIVVNILNYEHNIKSISKIGITATDAEKIKRLIKEPQGLVLITGNASSGKTTTMYSMLKEINSKSINIISIEDPVKMNIEGINQVQISQDKGITYKTALKQSLLQDPNIICIDNLIDTEITREAIRASITGKLVISSLYTKNAFTTIDTLLNMDIEKYLLSTNLNGIISQRLAKRLCPTCKEKRQATAYEKNTIKMVTGKDIEELYYQKGCEECQGGYISQIPVLEVIEINDEIRNAISNNYPRETIRKLLYSNNNSLFKDGLIKVLAGETTFDEIIRITDIKDDFSQEQQELKDYILGKGEVIKPIEQDASTEETQQETVEQTTTIAEQQIQTPQPVEEQPATETQEVSEQIVETQIVEQPVQPTIATAVPATSIEDEEEDEDDFNYSEGYENSF